MNVIDPSINFTMEHSDSSVKFLELLVYRANLGFKTVVQSKCTDSNTLLNYKSSHPRHCRDNIPFNLARRVVALTDDEDKAKEQLAALSLKLINAGYPVGLVHSAVQNALSLSSEDLHIRLRMMMS